MDGFRFVDPKGNRARLVEHAHRPSVTELRADNSEQGCHYCDNVGRLYPERPPGPCPSCGTPQRNGAGVRHRTVDLDPALHACRGCADLTVRRDCCDRCTGATEVRNGPVEIFSHPAARVLSVR